MATKPRPRHEVRRVRERARYDRESLHAVLDAGWVATVAFVVDGQPFAIPMLYARDGDAVLLHGAVASRLVQVLADGAPCCLCVTHVDGLVLARSHFHHSANYRSAVVFGTARAIDDPAAKREALARFVDAMLPGRAADTRAPDDAELGATRVLRLEVEDASVKIRAGGPKDHPDDVARPAWAGVVPTPVVRGAPVPADDNRVPPPAYLLDWVAAG